MVNKISELNCERCSFHSELKHFPHLCAQDYDKNKQNLYHIFLNMKQTCMHLMYLLALYVLL